MTIVNILRKISMDSSRDTIRPDSPDISRIRAIPISDILIRVIKTRTIPINAIQMDTPIRAIRIRITTAALIPASRSVSRILTSAIMAIDRLTAFYKFTAG